MQRVIVSKTDGFSHARHTQIPTVHKVLTTSKHDRDTSKPRSMQFNLNLNSSIQFHSSKPRSNSITDSLTRGRYDLS